MKNKNVVFLIIIICMIIGYFIYSYFNNKNYELIEDENILDLKNSIDNKDDNNIIEEKNNVMEKENIISKEEKNNDKIVIHIVGEVVNEGVYELKSGSRIIDAVNIAGGLTENADVTNINLAYILSDETKIYVPSKSEENERKYIENRG